MKFFLEWKWGQTLLILGISLSYLALVQAGAPLAAAQGGPIIRVAPNGTDTATCGSVASPCRTLPHVVDNLVQIGGSATILVAGGTYTGASARGREVISVFGENITIKGGYTTAFTTPDPAQNVTIIDGQNVRSVITVEPDGTTNTLAILNLSGVTLTNGRAPTDVGSLDSFGGGINAFKSTEVTLSNVKVTNNTAQGLNSGSGLPGSGGGGGLSFRQSTVTLSQVELTNNVAQGGAGSGSASRGGLGVGAGLFAFQSTISIDTLLAMNNTARGGDAPGSPGANGVQRADGLGGGLNFTLSSVSANNLTIVTNTAQGGQAGTLGGLGLGGGIFIELATAPVSLKTATIRSNTARGGTASGTGGAGLGGGVYSGDGALVVEQATIVSNLAEGVNGGPQGGDGGGGGIYLDSTTSAASSLSVSSVIVGNNMAKAGSGATKGLTLGGGIFIQRGASGPTNGSLTHVTLANNVLTNGQFSDGGAALFVNNNATLTSNYAIVANHTETAAAVQSKSNITFNNTLWNNNTQNTQNDQGGVITDNFPLSGSPAFVNPTGNLPDFHIQATSAARDKATGSSALTDVDGQNRPFGNIADLGADEYYAPLSDNSSFLKSVTPSAIRASNGPTHVATYTIKIANTTALTATGVAVTDTLPSPSPPITLGLAAGPTCSSGTCSGSGKVITWRGNISGGETVTIAYRAALTIPTTFTKSVTIVNKANLNFVDNGVPVAASTSATLLINGKMVYLPTVIKN